MRKQGLSNLEKSMKISQKKNRESFAKVAERILALSQKQTFSYEPDDPLKNLRKNYFELTDLLTKAQRGSKDSKLRQQIRSTTESVVLDAINFHLNFFRPSLLGLSEGNAFRRLMRRMKVTFARKNADYGSAFRFWGIPGLLVRIGDKYFRLIQLSQKSYKRKVEDERLPDTALDLANYGIMLLMLLDEGRSLQWGK